MSAIIPFKLTDDRRTTITPGYIAIVGRRLGKWIYILQIYWDWIGNGLLITEGAMIISNPHG